MLQIHIEEFMAVTGWLLAYQEGEAAKPEGTQRLVRRNGYLYVPRKIMNQLLNENAYKTADQKLEVWRRLRWIESEKGHFTKRVHHNGKYMRRVVLSVSVYEELQRISSEKWDTR